MTDKQALYIKNLNENKKARKGFKASDENLLSYCDSVSEFILFLFWTLTQNCVLLSYQKQTEKQTLGLFDCFYKTCRISYRTDKHVHIKPIISKDVKLLSVPEQLYHHYFPLIILKNTNISYRAPN